VSRLEHGLKPHALFLFGEREKKPVTKKVREGGGAVERGLSLEGRRGHDFALDETPIKNN
jgi:hypothetical protein